MPLTPSILYESARRTTAVASGMPRRRYPLPQNSPILFDAYAFDQDFEMLLANYPPAPKNTIANSGAFVGLTDSRAVLTRLSQPSTSGGGRGKFTGSFCIIPAPWDDFKTQAVTFPGWLNSLASGLARPSFSDVVNVRLHYDYFLVDPSNIAGGVLDSAGNSATTVTSMGKIPSLAWPRWLNMLIVTGTLTPEVNSTVNDLVPTGGVTVGLNSYQQTFPSATQYRAWCATATSFLAGSTAWDSSHPLVFTPSYSASPWGITGNEGQFQFANSTLRVMEGNIIERMTPFVMAE